MTSPSATEPSETEHAAVHWFALVRACIDNGDGLLADAEVLRTAGSPRALALAVLAVEEYGKAIQALLVINGGGAPDEVSMFERARRAHRPKIEMGTMWTAMLDLRVRIDEAQRDRLLAVVLAASERKMAAFYVDRVDGAVLEPRHVVTPADVTAHIDAATVLSGLIHPIADVIDTTEKLVAAWEYGPIVQEAILKELADFDEAPEGALQAMRERFPEFGIHTIGAPRIA